LRSGTLSSRKLHRLIRRFSRTAGSPANFKTITGEHVYVIGGGYNNIEIGIITGTRSLVTLKIRTAAVAHGREENETRALV